MLLPAASASIDQAAQFLEELGHTMNLVKNDETFLVVLKEQRRVGQLAAIGPRLEVEVQRFLVFADLEGKRRFSHLSGPDEGNGRLPGEGVTNALESASTIIHVY